MTPTTNLLASVTSTCTCRNNSRAHWQASTNRKLTHHMWGALALPLYCAWQHKTRRACYARMHHFHTNFVEQGTDKISTGPDKVSTYSPLI
jgi:hypothetical protein